MSTLRLIIGAGKATPTPPIGPALGQRGVKSMDFCKQFNERTKDYIQGTPISTLITVKKDKSFTFVTKTPPTTWLLKKAAGVEKGSARPGEVDAGTISVKHVYEIAKIKQADPAFIDSDLHVVCKSVVGTAKTMGIKIEL